MATNTKKFKFKKPDESDFYDVQDQNGNWDMADEELEKLNTPTFEDYSGGTSIPEASNAINEIRSGFSLPTLLSNIKAAFKGACLLGHIVNNCVTDNSKLPLSAAQGKKLMDMVTQLNSEAAKKTTFTLPPGSKTLQFPNTYFCFLLSIQGGFGQLYADFLVTGYGDGGSNRYHVATLQCGNNINISVGGEGARSITLSNTSTNTAQCVMLNII